VIKISGTVAYYEYTVETAEDGYVCTSRRRLILAEGSRIKIAIQGGEVFIIDDDGRTQPTNGVSQYRRPAQPIPKKAVMQPGDA
jgi:hypothetical protein